MKIIQYYVVCCIAMVWLSCGESSPSTPQLEPSGQTYIVGLASPIKLQHDSTIVILSDYFPDAVGIDRATLEGCIVNIDKKAGLLSIKGNLAAPLGNLEIYYNNVRHDIPVFASEKVKHRFTYKPTRQDLKTVHMSGSMNGWNYKATPLQLEGDVWVTDLVLNQGLYQYRIWEDEVEMMDANNKASVPNGMGAFNNTFLAGQEQGAKPRILTADAEKERLEILALDSIKHVYVYFENHLISHQHQGNTIRIHLPAASVDFERSHIRVFAADNQQRSNDVLVPLTYGETVLATSQLNRKDMQASIMYFMMVDRFMDGNPDNNRPTDDPEILPIANNLGGDLKGITQKVEDGYFQQLGINTLWISPITTNAEGAWGLWDKGIRSKFSGYHGYWPISLRTVDNRFGTEKELKELIEVAHDNNMNVILDYVAHHVHQEHPLYKQQPDWTTPLYLPDGTMNTEKWDEHRLTTWFDTFLPTWDFSNPKVVDALSDTAMYWVKNYDLDGFRHDATKHVSEDFWRTLTRKIKKYRAEKPERSIYQVGETYGSPELISSYISSGQMDAQFDFNLYDAAIDAFAKDDTKFDNLERVLTESLHYYGSHHLMGNITGNQDRARFISYADGSVQFSEDAKLAGWTRTITNKDASGYNKMAMLQAFLMTTPGIPCIYYGDEIGMPGGNDPDNRRMMTFTNWTSEQQNLQEQLTRLTKLRKESLALTYGDLMVLKNDGQALVYVRSYFGKTAIVVLNKQNKAYKTTIQLPEGINASYLKALNQSAFDSNDKEVVFTVPAQSYEILFN
jgi:cyclomaltodextrinase